MSPETNLTPLPPDDAGFAEVAGMIAAARQKAFQAVNTALIDLYWQVGQYISRKIAAAEWGDGVVPQLAAYIELRQPGIAALPQATYSEWKSSTRPTVTSQLVRHWRTNCRGATTSSSSGRANGLKSASSICGWPFGRRDMKLPR